jgi:hypothetical protein
MFFERTNGKCYVFKFLFAIGKMFLRILMARIIYGLFSQLIDHCVTQACTS